MEARGRSCCLGGMAIGLFALAGCVANPFESSRYRGATECSMTEIRSPIIHTRPHPRLDRWERLVEWPQRLIGRAAQDDIALSEETVEMLRQYLAENGLRDVRIVYNEYSPLAQWWRLRENERISAGWKYSIGTATVIGGTLFPARVFDRNKYNPFTNTLEINSDRPFEILNYAVVAHRVESHDWRDLYVVTTQLRPIGMVNRLNAGYEALDYARSQNDWKLEQAGYRQLYPQTANLGTIAAAPFLPLYAMPLVGLGGNMVGTHVANRTIEKLEHERSEHESSGAPLTSREAP